MFQSIREKVIVGVVTAVAIAAIYAAWGAVKRAGDDVFIPKGAVIAFAVPCPSKGWRHFAEANGRFLIGAGEQSHPKHGTWQQTQPDGNLSQPIPLTIYDLTKSGGEESHVLSEAEMPSHTHNFKGRRLTRGDVAGSRETSVARGGALHDDIQPTGVNGTISKTGNGMAHNNIPPFYALNFCIKE